MVDPWCTLMTPLLWERLPKAPNTHCLIRNLGKSWLTKQRTRRWQEMNSWQTKFKFCSWTRLQTRAGNISVQNFAVAVMLSYRAVLLLPRILAIMLLKTELPIPLSLPLSGIIPLVARHIASWSNFSKMTLKYWHCHCHLLLPIRMTIAKQIFPCWLTFVCLIICKWHLLYLREWSTDTLNASFEIEHVDCVTNSQAVLSIVSQIIGWNIVRLQKCELKRLKNGFEPENFVWKEAWEGVHNRQLSPKMNKEGSLFQLKPSVWDSDCGVGLFYKGPDGGYKLFPLFCTSLYKYLYNAPPVLSAGLHNAHVSSTSCSESLVALQRTMTC